jgi:hypothetical protein
VLGQVANKEHTNGKGDSYRIPVGDKQYKENYDKIFTKQGEK